MNFYDCPVILRAAQNLLLPAPRRDQAPVPRLQAPPGSGECRRAFNLSMTQAYSQLSVVCCATQLSKAVFFHFNFHTPSHRAEDRDASLYHSMPNRPSKRASLAEQQEVKRMVNLAPSAEHRWSRCTLFDDVLHAELFAWFHWLTGYNVTAGTCKARQHPARLARCFLWMSSLPRTWS